MVKNKKGFSIIIGMGLVVLITLSSYVIFSYMIPFIKNVSGVENTSNAYYQAYKGVEEALYHIKTRDSLITETGGIIGDSMGCVYETFSSGATIPLIGYGNSKYDSDYNTISVSNPIQLQIGRKDHNISDLRNKDINFTFKVPDLNPSGGTFSLFGSNTYPYISWILAGENDTLVSSGGIITKGDINSSDGTTSWNIKSEKGLTLLGESDIAFSIFYENNCNGAASGCTLKMSLLNNLELTNGEIIPYLEYKIEFPGKVADRYTRIDSYGKSQGFQKNIQMKVAQNTVEQSFDFTIFQ